MEPTAVGIGEGSNSLMEKETPEKLLLLLRLIFPSEVVCRIVWHSVPSRIVYI